MNTQDKKRLNKLIEEFKLGFEKLSTVKRGITIYGSARTSSNDKYYKAAEKIAYKLAKKGYSIITGAGKGIMEAANKGASKAGGVSVGLNIELPRFQCKNEYINNYVCFKHFYSRKVMFTKYSFANIVMPGGYGTIDEIFDLLAILQNGKIKPRPLVLFGKDYFGGLVKWLEETVYPKKKISSRDLGLFYLVDNVDDVVNIIDREYNGKSKKFFI